MENHSYLVKITPVHSANEHQVFMREYDVWKQAVNTLTTLSFVADKRKTMVTIDWGNAMEILNELETYKNIERGKEKVDQATRKKLFTKRWQKWESGEDKINLTCTVLTEEKHNPEQFVKQYLFLLYLCINIAEPGAGGIAAEISALDSSKKESKNLGFYLTSEPFEHVDIPLRKLSYPSFISLNFQETWNWLEKIGIMNQSVAESNIQRAIFAMLNYCQNDSYMYPTGLLWLSIGLEALYDLPSIGISSALRERVFLTLGAPKNSKQIKRLTVDFY